jgi:lysophospholipase L1-like esterase
VPQALKVIVLGHSFVSGLRDHYWARFGKWKQQNVALEGFIASELKVDHHVAEVHLLGQSGALASDFLLPQNSVSPDICLIELGTNDLAQGARGQDVARDILNLSKNCHHLRHV